MKTLVILTLALMLSPAAAGQMSAPKPGQQQKPSGQPQLPPAVRTPPNGLPSVPGFQNWDFELGSLQGWTETGTAFDSQPTFEDNVAARRPGIQSSHHGNFWVGTFENRPDAAAPLGRTQGDERTGRLTSPDFTIERRYISFLLGGGRVSGRETLQVNLLVIREDGSTGQFKAADGRNSEEMKRVVWDVGAVRGKRARIEIVDEATGPWGHINVDDFRFTDAAPPDARSEELGTPGPAPVRTGRFRVTINGFIAYQQTWDDALQRDGKDDEVFLLSETRLLSRVNDILEISPLPEARSIQLGDIQGFETRRLRAGSASDLGGIRSGDRVPVDMPWARHREPGGNGLPFIIWEGELTADRTAAMIVPTIWEWDGGDTPLAFILRTLLDGWAGGGSTRGMPELPAGRPGASLLKRLSEVQIGRDVVGTNVTYDASVVGWGGNRPIGMWFSAGSYMFDPWVLYLTHERALAASQTDYGRGRGVIEVIYEDAADLRGRYTLFVQIEQRP